LQVLNAVAEGAYASNALLVESAILDSRDAGLASQIVFGCLRFQDQLDHLIFFYSGRHAADLDTPVAIALRTAIFQLRYLDRIPAHAAVHDTVELVKRYKPAAAGLANAVLRKVNRQPVRWPDLATELSCPAWLLQRWTEHFGPELTRTIAEAALTEPIPYIRIAPGTEIPNGLAVEPASLPGSFRLLSQPLPGMRLHDIGSQSVIPLLNLQPEHTFLDLCAAPGNKTIQALEQQLSLAVACDVSETRLREIPPICPRAVLDASQPLPFSHYFDRIFIDAPCSGTGTLGRNPEIKWRVQRGDLYKFGQKQIRILARASEVLKPGGRIVYATCSLEQEENEDVVHHFVKQHPRLRCEKEVWRLPGRDEGDGFYAAVLG
jgi:16S rRNA (cytosine967-C5)-methyltransferase